jgi:hypothetical protein
VTDRPFFSKFMAQCKICDIIQLTRDGGYIELRLNSIDGSFVTLGPNDIHKIATIGGYEQPSVMRSADDALMAIEAYSLEEIEMLTTGVNWAMDWSMNKAREWEVLLGKLKRLRKILEQKT